MRTLYQKLAVNTSLKHGLLSNYCYFTDYLLHFCLKVSGLFLLC